MSFGYSISDFITLGQLAWTVYKSCKDAPESFGNISQEVLSLHVIIKEFEDNVSGQAMTAAQLTGLRTVGDGCRSVLRDLESLVAKYESLGTKSKRTWDRLAWGFKDIAELRARLTSNTVLLTAFISTSQAIVQNKLDKFLVEFQEGKRESSVVSIQTVESLSTNDKEIWRSIRKDLADVGVTTTAFNANKDFIVEWFRNAIATGAFEEQEPKHIPDERSLHPLSGKSKASSISDFGGVLATRPPSSKVAAPNSNGMDEQSIQSAVSQEVSVTRQPKETLDAQTIPSSTPSEPLGIASATSRQQRRIPRVVTLMASLLRRNSALVDAAESQDEGKVQRLLRKGADIKWRSPVGQTALHKAAGGGDENIVRILLEAGAEISTVSIFGNTPLHEAAGYGHDKIAKVLLEAGIDISSVNIYGNTPLHNAALSGRNAMVQTLIVAGADISSVNSAGNTPLHEAALRGSNAMVQTMLNAGADISSVNAEGNTLLHEAALRGNLIVTLELLNSGAEISLPNARGDTALHVAARAGKLSIVHTLLNAGVNVSAQNRRGESALHTAASYGNLYITYILLERGSDVNAVTLEGMTALHVAICGRFEEVARSLVEARSDVFTKTGDGETALDLLAKNGMVLSTYGIDALTGKFYDC